MDETIKKYQNKTYRKFNVRVSQNILSNVKVLKIKSQNYPQRAYFWEWFLQENGLNASVSRLKFIGNFLLQIERRVTY